MYFLFQYFCTLLINIFVRYNGMCYCSGMVLQYKADKVLLDTELLRNIIALLLLVVLNTDQLFLSSHHENIPIDLYCWLKIIKLGCHF